MSRLEEPGGLGRHLARTARVWNGILGDLDARGIELLGRIDGVARYWSALHREVLTPFGINYAELTTLGILRVTPAGAQRPESLPRRSPSELRALVGQTSAGMTRILDKLEDEALVRRESSPDDGRRVDVVLTRAGARLAERAFRELVRAQNEVLAAVDGTDTRAMVAGLDRLLAAFARRARGRESDPAGRTSA